MVTTNPEEVAAAKIEEARKEGSRSLSLLGLGLKELPNTLWRLPQLKTLNLAMNHLSVLPDEISRLHNLTYLWLYRNELRRLPRGIGELEELQELYIRENKLEELPLELNGLPKLKRLDVGENPILGLPPEILVKTPQEILEYYFQTTRGSRRLNEAKVLLVGQGAVGKTSLLKRLVYGTFDEKEAKTEGINIQQWPVEAPEGETVRLNLWDFGGQEIMHATHQFFLTKRSLYVLVLDARAGENQGNLHYWLEMIRVYGGNSPLIIVLNKCEQHYEELDENRLRLDYGKDFHIAGFHYTSCKNGQGIEQLRNAIRQVACELPHVSDRLPEDYFSVKERLEKHSTTTDFITEEEYIAICEEYGLGTREHCMRLLRFLHDLGCVLHYDDPDQVYQIRDTKILNPEWVTGGVYRILNDPGLIRKADGIVSRLNLRNLLSLDTESRRRYPEHRYPFLIDMMRKYQLCFDFPDDSKKLLVPELLSKNEPDVGWVPRESINPDVLDFEYWYIVLPQGLIPRLIVRLHHLLTSRPTYWRAGVVLGVEGCRVLIRGDARIARVFIQIQGERESQRRSALSVVRDSLEAIHQTYGNLKAEAKVPLPNDPGAPAVDYQFLLDLERTGVTEQWFEKAKDKYNVCKLLDGVEEREPNMLSKNQKPRW